MNGKQLYYGNIKKRSAEKPGNTLTTLYKESESNKDISDFLDNTENIDEETPKEKKSAKKQRQKAEKHAETKKKIKKENQKRRQNHYLAHYFGWHCCRRRMVFLFQRLQHQRAQ